MWLTLFTTHVATVYLFSVVSVRVCVFLCLSVCLSINTITLVQTVKDRPIIMAFSAHHSMVERAGKFENGYVEARVVN